ncbi:MAG: 23S rRNA (adenine(2503)-C(2))-methyltransferase RlmN [Pseudomonadales bacterium]|nr:23S rRNA (adenine(2503)-C(2))-methyltransferase RlmN [Pseudomonadales bacterium]
MKLVDKTNLMSLTREGLTDFFLALGEKPYRAVQVMKWIYHRGVYDIALMTDLSQDLRSRLQECACIELSEIVSEHLSVDGTRKWIIRVAGGNCIETVLIPERSRNTLCISSQVGCILNCSFCSTGKQGFDGNLTAAEIIGQVWLASQRMRELGLAQGVTNVVFMGMGEPLMNFDAVMTAASVFMDDLGFGLSKRKVTVSTAGVVPGILKMVGTTDCSIAISLHAPSDDVRNGLVPLNKKYPISELLAACRSYLETLGERRHVTVEYTLIKGVNDHIDQAKELAKLLRDVSCKINLIPFNSFPASGYEVPDAGTIDAFQSYLIKSGYATMLRTTRGDDIAAACGQLAGQVKDRTRRQEKYLARVKALEIA